MHFRTQYGIYSLYLGKFVILTKQLKTLHYDYTPMQYIVNFNGCKNDNFQFNLFLLIFAQNIVCGYMLELRRF